MAEDNGVRLSSNIQKDIEIDADETLIMRMIINLLTNAIKYSRSCSNPKVELSLTKEDRIKIVIKDNGIGIKKKKTRQISSAGSIRWINPEQRRKTALVSVLPW